MFLFTNCKTNLFMIIYFNYQSIYLFHLLCVQDLLNTHLKNSSFRFLRQNLFRFKRYCFRKRNLFRRTYLVVTRSMPLRYTQLHIAHSLWHLYNYSQTLLIPCVNDFILLYSLDMANGQSSSSPSHLPTDSVRSVYSS